MQKHTIDQIKASITNIHHDNAKRQKRIKKYQEKIKLQEQFLDGNKDTLFKISLKMLNEFTFFVTNNRSLYDTDFVSFCDRIENTLNSTNMGNITIISVEIKENKKAFKLNIEHCDQTGFIFIPWKFLDNPKTYTEIKYNENHTRKNDLLAKQDEIKSQMKQLENTMKQLNEQIDKIIV